MTVLRACERTVLILLLTFTGAVARAQVTEIIDSTGDGMGHPLYGPGDVTVDSGGNVYVPGHLSDNAFKVEPDGTITQLIDASGDGTGHILDGPSGVAVDAAGNVFVCGFVSRNAFRIDPDGTITQIIDEMGDGAGNLLHNPVRIAVDSTGNAFVASFFPVASSVFKITPGGSISEIIDESGDGLGNNLFQIMGLAVDASGNVFVSGIVSDNVFKVTPAGSISEIIDASGDGSGNELSTPTALDVDSSGNVYVVGGGNDSNCFKVSATGAITKILDSSGDGMGAPFAIGADIAVDSAGLAYAISSSLDFVLQVTPGGSIFQVLMPSALLETPSAVAVDGAGNVYVAGSDSRNVIKLQAPPVQGSCAIRNGSGTNPADFSCSNVPRLGMSWDAVIDPLPTVGVATIGTGVVFGLGGPSSDSFYKGYEILIAGPSIAMSSATGMHSFPVPASASLLGLPLSTQGVRLEDTGSDLVWVLLNAVDIVVGM